MEYLKGGVDINTCNQVGCRGAWGDAAGCARVRHIHATGLQTEVHIFSVMWSQGC